MTTNAGTPILAKKNPWTPPAAAPPITAMITASHSGIPRFTFSAANVAPARPASEPTDRSISPISSTKTMPTATMPVPTMSTLPGTDPGTEPGPLRRFRALPLFPEGGAFRRRADRCAGGRVSQFQAAEDVGAVDELVDSADRRQGEDGRAGDAGGQGPGEAFGVQDPRVISSRDNSFSRSVGRGQCLDRVRQFGNLPRAAVFRRLSSSIHETIAASKNGALHHQFTAEEPHHPSPAPGGRQRHGLEPCRPLRHCRAAPGIKGKWIDLPQGRREGYLQRVSPPAYLISRQGP